MQQPAAGIEERLGTLIIDGQRCEVSVRSEPDEDGTWHNALVFRRDGRVTGKEVLMTGVEWHLPPGVALQRAQELPDMDRLELFQRALRPREPLI